MFPPCGMLVKLYSHVNFIQLVRNRPKRKSIRQYANTCMYHAGGFQFLTTDCYYRPQMCVMNMSFLLLRSRYNNTNTNIVVMEYILNLHIHCILYLRPKKIKLLAMNIEIYCNHRQHQNETRKKARCNHVCVVGTYIMLVIYGYYRKKPLSNE